MSVPGADTVRRSAVVAATIAVIMAVASPAWGAAPTISSFSPTGGVVGTSVTINGTSFNGTTAVRFNGTSASFNIDSGTRITATVPSGATTGPISVTADGTATSDSDFEVFVDPNISSFSPTSGPVGTTVTINGSGFAGTTSVKFAGTSASFTLVSGTKITATVPAGATTGRISVTTPGGTDTSDARFTVTTGPKPTISSFSPTSGPVGTTVTIRGTNFTGATAVKFAGRSASFTVDTATKITATVPSGAVTGPAFSSTRFRVTTAKPTISSFSPTSGPVGTLVTINGTNFTGTTSVKFAGTTAPFTVNSSTRIGATVPAGAATGRISVTTPGGTATSSTPFTVTGVRHPRSIALHLRRHLRVSGNVAVIDGFSACRANVPVKIQRHRLGIGNWRTILRLSTDASGAFAAHVPNRSGRYRARAVRVELVTGDICLRASSGAHRYVR
jgi:hypothetical protein